MPQDPTENDTDAPPEVLLEVLQEIRQLRHDLNNPLAVIDGNLQLWRELAQAYDLDAELTQPFDHAREATDRLVVLLRRLDDLRDRLAEAVGEERPTRLG